jgi:hypothetical protein
VSSQKTNYHFFDSLVGNEAPYIGFGGPIEELPCVCANFQDIARGAGDRVCKGFGIRFSNLAEVPRVLDGIIHTMWETGWDPESGKIDLFVHDFGVLFAANIKERFGGTQVFRSERDLTHFSLFWPRQRVEAFPFHKMAKCLLHREGEKLEGFVKGLTANLARVQ